MVGENGQEDVPHRMWLQVYDEVLNEVKDSLKQQGREDEFIGSKVSPHPPQSDGASLEYDG